MKAAAASCSKEGQVSYFLSNFFPIKLREAISVMDAINFVTFIGIDMSCLQE